MGPFRPRHGPGARQVLLVVLFGLLGAARPVSARLPDSAQPLTDPRDLAALARLLYGLASPAGFVCQSDVQAFEAPLGAFQPTAWRAASPFTLDHTPDLTLASLPRDRVLALIMTVGLTQWFVQCDATPAPPTS